MKKKWYPNSPVRHENGCKQTPHIYNYTNPTRDNPHPHGDFWATNIHVSVWISPAWDGVMGDNIPESSMWVRPTMLMTWRTHTNQSAALRHTSLQWRRWSETMNTAVIICKIKIWCLQSTNQHYTVSPSVRHPEFLCRSRRRRHHLHHQAQRREWHYQSSNFSVCISKRQPYTDPASIAANKAWWRGDGIFLGWELTMPSSELWPSSLAGSWIRDFFPFPTNARLWVAARVVE